MSISHALVEGVRPSKMSEYNDKNKAAAVEPSILVNGLCE